jgi:hypothetical protein
MVSRSASVERGLALSFFIVLPLASGCESGVDDSGAWRSLHESYYEKPASSGHPENEVSLLAGRMIGVQEQNREGVAEGSDGLVVTCAV